MLFLFFFSSRRRHTSCALVTGVQTCALPIYHNHRADYRDSIISEKRSGEDEPHGKVRAVEIFAMGRACLDAQIAGVRPVESIDDVVHAVLPGLPDRLKREAIVERVEWLLQDVTERRWS